MTNREFYKDEIKKHMDSKNLYSWLENEVKILSKNCSYATERFLMWLDEEYVEPEDKIVPYNVYKASDDSYLMITNINGGKYYILYDDETTASIMDYNFKDYIKDGSFELAFEGKNFLDAYKYMMGE